jgi:ATP-dependent DNA helicase RecQ
LREIRKEVALAEAVPPYAVFIDEELAELSKLSELTAAGMLLVKGIGTKKVERYGQLFINALNNEKSGATDRKDS